MKDLKLANALEELWEEQEQTKAPKALKSQRQQDKSFELTDLLVLLPFALI